MSAVYFSFLGESPPVPSVDVPAGLRQQEVQHVGAAARGRDVHRRLEPLGREEEEAYLLRVESGFSGPKFFLQGITAPASHKNHRRSLR